MNLILAKAIVTLPYIIYNTNTETIIRGVNTC